MTAIIAISSQVARGHVGNSATQFALQRMGHAVWALPTVVLPYHPGHGRSHAAITRPGDLDKMLKALAESRWAGEISAIVSGYLAEPEQAAAIAAFVAAIKARNDAAIYCCDPILGDDGNLYVPQTVARAVRDELMPLADMATPNLFELSWLTGADVSDNGKALAAARTLKSAETLVTSAHALTRGGIATLLAGPHAAYLAETRMLDNVPRGTGDLMTALFLGHRLNHARGEEALTRASAALHALITRTVQAGLDEFALAAHQDALFHTATPVRLHHMSAARTRQAGETS